MVRSIWKGTLVTTFAWAGLAWAQQPIPSSSPAARPGESTVQTFTVQEAGKAGQKCKVLKSWKTPEGKTAYQVQALDTGEMMTIVETGSVKNLPAVSADNGSRAQAVTTRIFHWGMERMPPPGTPMPPVENSAKMPPPRSLPEPQTIVTTDPVATARPTVPVRSETTQPPIVTYTEPPKRSRLFPWFSRSTETQVPPTPMVLPQANSVGSAPTTPSSATLQNSTPTMPPASSGSRGTEPWTPILNKPNSLPDKPSDSLAPRPTVYNPYSALTPAASAPATPPSTVAPHRIVQVVPPKSDAPSSATSSLAPADLAPKSPLVNQQAVPLAPVPSTVIPSANEKKPPTATLNASGQPTSARPGPSSTTSTTVPGKTVPATPSIVTPSVPLASGGSTTVPSANDKKPANAALNVSGPSTTALPAPNPTTNTMVPFRTAPATPSTVTPPPTMLASPPSGSKPSTLNLTTTPFPSVTAAKTNASIPTGPSISVPSTVSSPQPSNLSGSTATSMKRVDEPKPATTMMTPSMSITTGTPTQVKRFEETKPAATIPTSSPVTTVNTPAPVTIAPPTDWRKSWGKTEENKAPATDKPVQSSGDSKPAPAKSLLPQADSKRPDPLQMPTQYDRRPADEKPSAQKMDTMLVPAAAAAPSTAVKPTVTTVPQPVTTIAPPVKVAPPASSLSVPLGAQSVIQAGDPGPGAVRYIPVPVVTIPDVRRAPVPPMTTPAQVYGMSGAAPQTSAGMQANAFTPAPSRQALAQTTNAFGSGVPAMATTASSSPIPASGSPSSNNPANANVVSARFHGATPANQVVPATYQAALAPAMPPCPSLTLVKPTPENIHQLVTSLRDSLYPSQREWAADNLAAVDWRTHPEVVQVLTATAREDPAATVRVGCIRCLARMNVNTVPVVSAVRDLKNDVDPRVRQEAERALSTLAPGTK